MTAQLKQMNKIIIINPPEDCWEKGYPIHKGINDTSLNKTTQYAFENNILPDKKRLQASFKKFKETLILAGFEVVVLDFPEELNTKDSIHHDAVFIRDSGFMFEDMWIKANFSAVTRQAEAESYAKIIANKFNKRIVEMPSGAYCEFGEVIYLQTAKGSYYFGGLSRSNKEGHDFVKEIVKPDNYCLIKSRGYHLDTVFTPVLDKNNELVALIFAKNMLEDDSFENLKRLNIELIIVDNINSSDDDGLGNYAVNALISKGVMISGSSFTNPHVEKRLKELGVDFYVVSLTDFNFAGGSVHCLTNEIYE